MYVCLCVCGGVVAQHERSYLVCKSFCIKSSGTQKVVGDVGDIRAGDQRLACRLERSNRC